MFIFLFSIIADRFPRTFGWIKSTVTKGNSLEIVSFHNVSSTNIYLFIMQHGDLTGARYYDADFSLEKKEINTSIGFIPKFFCINNPQSLLIQATKTSFEVQGWFVDLGQLDVQEIRESAFLFMKIPLKTKFSISDINKQKLNFFTWFRDVKVDEEISVNLPGTYLTNNMEDNANGLRNISFEPDENLHLTEPYLFHFIRRQSELNPTTFTINNHYNGVSIDGETCEYQHLYQVHNHAFITMGDPLMNPSVDCEDESDSFRWWHWFIIAIGIAAVLSIIFLLVMFFVFGVVCCCQCPNCANVGEESWGRDKYKEKYEGSSSVSPVAF